VPHFEFLEGAASQSRRHEKAHIPANAPHRAGASGVGGKRGSTGRKKAGSSQEAIRAPTMALASNPKTHIAIVRTTVLCRALLVTAPLAGFRFAGLD
jgi:hypothetical protein